MDEKPDILIPKTASSLLPFATEESLKAHKQEVDKKLDWIFGFIIAILVVCFLGFVTFLIDAYKFHSETNAEYSKTLEGLRKENYEIRLHDLSTKVDQMQNKLNQKEQVSIGR